MKTSRPTSGFTLIEIMVVVIIIAALAGMVLPRVLPASDDAKRKIAKADLVNITTALKLYRLHHDRYPSTEEGLNVLLVPPSRGGWKEPYLDNKPMDPWSRKYSYKQPGAHNTSGFDRWSSGPDGLDGTEDDVSNWEG
jgi:general secretion pathway protein G